MPTPVLVIHGVATRNINSASSEDTWNFAYDQVAPLQRRIGSELQLIPVYWGDLGASSTDYILDTLTFGEEDSKVNIERELAIAVLSEKDDDSDDIRGGEAELIANIALASLTNSQRDYVRSGFLSINSLKQMVDAALASTSVLAQIHDTTILIEIGNMLGAALENKLSTQEEGDFAKDDEVRAGSSGKYHEAGESNIANTVSKIIHGIDRLLGYSIGERLGKFNYETRRLLGQGFARFFGDVFAYQRNQSQIHERIWQAIDSEAPSWGCPEKPIHVVAHSLGGVIMFDAAVNPVTSRGPLHIENFITFGSQAAFFHAIDQRQSLAPYSGQSVQLPPTIGKWSSIWEPLDFLAFRTNGIFKLASGMSPIDVCLKANLSSIIKFKCLTHSLYWTSSILYDLISDLPR